MNPNPQTIHTGKPAPFDRNMTVNIREGDAGTDDTIAAMIAFAQHAAESIGNVLQLFLDVKSLHNPTTRGLYKVLDDCVTFRADPATAELVRTPAQMVAEIADNGVTYGDCDDRATLGVATMLAWNKHRPGTFAPCFCVCGLRADQPFQHVYCGDFNNLRPPARIRDFTDRAELTYDVFGIDPQERITPGGHAKAARYRVYPVKPKGL